MLTKEEFQSYVDSGFNIIPVVEDLLLENQSPLTIYSQISDKSNTFLLESVEGGDKWSQYSIIGFNCSDTIKVTGNVIELKNGDEITSFSSDDPLNEIQKITSSFKSADINNLPRFHGGYVGFFAYESAQYAEKKIADLPAKESKFQEHMPEIFLVKAEQLVVYDNFKNTAQFIFNANPSKHSYEIIKNQIDEMKASFSSVSTLEEIAFKDPKSLKHFESNFKKEEYLEAVNKIKNYIKEGDVFQVVLAQDFYSKFDLNPFNLYRAIRKLNPSPYMYFLDLEECQVVGSSPEILVRLENDKLTLRPIAGTRKRGKDSKEDKQNEDDLLNDPKELAEHLMLIDLGRNDVGRVSEIGSVKVTDKMIIEKYSHVMHIVSNVVGTLSKDLDYLDALKASLPAGTLSGAPKIRAMEIINELEPSSRGIYGGAIGYISWNGNVDTAIAIRTAVIKDKMIHVGAGAGIVADSIPENEWLECIQKSKAFVDALEMIS
ncbi:MAG: anthranilate synthase component I [Proteobacteria bacterium]|uniref:Anthranilate synthase component 1 n=1 Tax=SAR86 cluster bacterium TaxID=2030880 RepID=A0A937I5V1_9GAMM|nr:anthranilate synthase component I [SAR86 cluster bacterium]MDA0775708.1 anthranilate synthase component I [Pseudomonadota bacterium]MDA0976604.1 anthranilate synthase component I [Pseudomonadota bacterium]MDA1037587.1 anthranilate synthase component I [Pseudomonadota bacterium]